MMTLSPSLAPTDDDLYAALLARDPGYEGRAFVCVTSTGIFCRLTCPARKPKRQNCLFHDSVAACVAQGFRPCLRCQPMAAPAGADPLVLRLLEALEADPQRRWREADLVAMGIDPSTARRAFGKRFGTSFLEMARARRVGAAAGRLAAGGPVIEAQLDGGYDSGSGFREAVQRMLGAPPAALKGRALLNAAWIETPLGPMLAVSDAQALRLLEFADRPGLPAEIARLTGKGRVPVAMARTAPIAATEAALAAYFAGAPVPEVPLGLGGTPFQRRVWEALLRLGPGEVTSYAALAEGLGRPEAVRAVGRANGANVIAILVPCHRVVGANGDPTGYGGGIWRKRWLLAHEAQRALGDARPG